MKYLLKIIGFNIALVFLMFLLLEISIRFIYPEIKLPSTSSSLIKDNVYFNSPGLMPNSVGTTSGAIREVDNNGYWKYSKNTKEISSKKWLLLGDSVTMGIGVESDSTFAGLINNRLENIKVLNTALIGYSIYDYYNIVKHFFANNKNNFNIDRVILFWCLNDIYSSSMDKDVTISSRIGLLNNIIKYFRTYFKTYHYFKLLFLDRPKAYFDFDLQFYQENDGRFLKAIELIKEFNQTFSKLDIPFTIFFLPYEYQLRVENRGNTQFKLFSKFLPSLEVFDCSNAFNKKHISEKYYLYGDGIHFSNLGHKYMADYVLSCLIK